MKAALFTSAALVLIALSFNAEAATTTTVEVATFSDLRNVTVSGSSPNVIVVRGHSASNDGGGGIFARGVQSCNADDDGVIVQENSGHGSWCWYRQFSGPVHLPWYGVVDAADPNVDCFDHAFSGCDSTAALNAALDAADQSKGLGGDGGVTTDGRSIAILGDVTIPENQYLTCSGTPGGSRVQTGSTAKPYWTLPNSIVLDPAHTLVRGRQSRLAHCIIRPTWYVPQTTPFNIPPTQVNETVQMMRLFSGVATSCQGKNCPMQDMFIFGFDTCEDNDQSEKTLLSDLEEECLVDEEIHNNGGGMKLQNFSSHPYLEGSLDDTVKRMTWDISNVQLTGTDSIKVTINGSMITSTALASGGGDTVLIDGLGQGNSVAPVSANGRWLTLSVTDHGSTADVVLIGASWAGPTDPSPAWKAGTSVITVQDATNIIPGQYACASGTAPFCTPPTGFQFSTVSLQTSIGSSTTTPLVTIVGSLAGWPVVGIAKIDSENVGYTIVDGSHVQINARGVRGTGGASHTIGATVTAAAPAVAGVAPTSEAVIVSSVAQSDCSSSCGSVTFASDTRIVSGTGFVLGQLTLNPGYHTWTWNHDVGPNPSGPLTVSGSSDPPNRKLAPAKNQWKIQPGMTVLDLTTPTNIQNGTDNGGTVDTVNGDGTVTLASGDTIQSFGSDTLRFIGCGYPAMQPWIGNCASTTLLLGGTNNVPPPDDPDEEAQGPTCEYMHSFGNEIQVHVINAPTTDCTNFVIAGGGGVGDQIDPDSVGFWFEGNATRTQFTNGRIAGATVSILDVPSPQSSGIGISNAEVPGHIIVGPGSDLVLTGLHGNMPSGDFVYVSGTTASLQASGTSLPLWTMYFDDPLVLSKVYCAGNGFATPACSQVKTAPTCPASSGCTSVAGTDSDFDVTTSGSATSVTVMLAANYPAKPICRVTPGATSGGAAVNSSVSSVNWQPYGTTVTFKTNNAVPHLYGSCHGPTG
jgi:hypothetical protein